MSVISFMDHTCGVDLKSHHQTQSHLVFCLLFSWFSCHWIKATFILVVGEIYFMLHHQRLCSLWFTFCFCGNWWHLCFYIDKFWISQLTLFCRVNLIQFKSANSWNFRPRNDIRECLVQVLHFINEYTMDEKYNMIYMRSYSKIAIKTVPRIGDNWFKELRWKIYW